jgi:serine protease AprX
MANRFFLFIFLLAYSSLHASDSLSYYVVYFKDKTNSNYSIDHPEEFLSKASIDRRAKWNIPIQTQDLPVNPSYIKAIQTVDGIDVINSSRWLNALEISSNSIGIDLNHILAFDFVKSVEFLGRQKTYTIQKSESIDEKYLNRARELQTLKSDTTKLILEREQYKKSYEQIQVMNLPELQNRLGRHPDIHIAVFDAGFNDAYKVPGMEDLLTTKTIIKDFVDYDNSVYEDDAHGCKVLSFMKTYNPGTYIGSAPFAQYTLIRTEQAYSEYPTEEFNWLLAAEFADSLGVDLIVSSLGYNVFDDVNLSHTKSDLDGKTSIIAKAANSAYQRGILVTTSAGNEGMNAWHKIGTPADAPGVIAIGACTKNGFYANFSSCGPSSDGRIKPDFIVPGYQVQVASPRGVYAGNGTSYATPLFGGAVSNLLALFPKTALKDIRYALVRSATHRHYPDTAYGYGIPDLSLAMYFLDSMKNTSVQSDIFWMKDQAVYYNELNIYYKSNSEQTVKLLVKEKHRKKYKVVYKSKYELKNGEWFDSSVLLELIEKSKKKRNKLAKTRTFLLELETENGTYMRSLQVN